MAGFFDNLRAGLEDLSWPRYPSSKDGATNQTSTEWTKSPLVTYNDGRKNEKTGKDLPDINAQNIAVATLLSALLEGLAGATMVNQWEAEPKAFGRAVSQTQEDIRNGEYSVNDALLDALRASRKANPLNRFVDWFPRKVGKSIGEGINTIFTGYKDGDMFK